MESEQMVSSQSFRFCCGMVSGTRTEDELLRGRKHIKRERHFILILLLLYPFREIGRLREEEGEGGY